MKLTEPTKFIKTESLHFIVDGEFIQDHSRQLYWFEDAEKSAINVVGCLTGITTLQIMNIINGDAILRGSSICKKKNCSQCKGLKSISYTEQEDKNFKKEIIKRRLWLHENKYKIDQYHISKEVVEDYLEVYAEGLNPDPSEDDYDELINKVKVFRESFWHTTVHRIPNIDFIPEKDSPDFIFNNVINTYLKRVEREIREALDDNKSLETTIKNILKRIEVIQEPTSSKIKKQTVRGTGCTLLVVPDPENNYKYKKINIPKEQLLNYLNTRSRGERSLKFTLNMDIDKEKVLKRYENLTKAMGLVHEELMHSMNLRHSSSGIYPRDMVEYYVNEAVQYFVLKTTIWHDGDSLEKLPNEIKLKLPPNRGYVDVYVDGKLVDEKRDLR